MNSRLIPARFKGKCRICGKVVQPGDMVYFAKHYGVRCQSCGPHTADDEPIPSKRSSQSSKSRSKFSSKREPKGSQKFSGKSSAQLSVWGADGIDRITFDSIAEAIKDAMTDYAHNEENRLFIAGRMKEHMTGHDRWANNYTKAQLLSAVENPPAELMESIDEMRRSLVEEVCPPASNRRSVRRNQDWGDELTPEAVLVRSLTPWERTARELQPKRTVTIGVNLTVSAGQRASELLWRGAAATALVDILTERGMNVEIVAYWTIRNMSSASKMVIAKYIVKRADMPLDVGAAAVALAEIAYARLVALYGLARHMPGKLHEGLGECADLPASDRAGIDYLAGTNIRSREAAEEWLKAAAASQEVEVLHV